MKFEVLAATTGSSRPQVNSPIPSPIPSDRKMVNLLTLNVSASLNVFRLIANPSLCLPHHTVPTFNHLPIPLSKAFVKDGAKVDIRAVVLDKDNCFAIPKQNEVYKPYKVSLSTTKVSSNIILSLPHLTYRDHALCSS